MLTLIDGNSILFRAYYGVHSRLTRSDGTPTGAVYGIATVGRRKTKRFVCLRV